MQCEWLHDFATSLSASEAHALIKAQEKAAPKASESGVKGTIQPSPDTARLEWVMEKIKHSCVPLRYDDTNGTWYHKTGFGFPTYQAAIDDAMKPKEDKEFVEWMKNYFPKVVINSNEWNRMLSAWNAARAAKKGEK